MVFYKVRNALRTDRGAACKLIIIYILAVLFTYFVVDSSAYGPVHFNDEVRYWKTALDISTGTFSVEGNYHHPPLYSLSIAPAFFFFSRFKVYDAVKALNALYITSVIFPVYFLLRKFLNRVTSIVASALMLLLPVHLVIPRSMISENIYYPLLLWALLLSFTNVLPVSKKNRLIEDMVLGVLLALLMLTRYISLALIPAFLFIWWIKPFPFQNEEGPFLISPAKLKHLLVILISLAVIEGIWLVAGASEGIPVRNLLGFFLAEDSNPAQLDFNRLFMWTVFYSCYLILLAGPALPVLIVSITHFNREKWREDFQRWCITLFVLLAAFMIACVRHSWKARYNYPDPSRVQGRYILYFAPLFIITAIISIRNLIQKKIKSSYLLLLMGFSIGLMIFSYFVLFKRLIYLDEPIVISMSSPFGYILTSLKAEFLYLVGLLIILVGIYLATLNKQILALTAVLVCVFYIYANINIYQSDLLQRQKPNYQISQLVNSIEENDDLRDNFRSNQLVFNVNPQVSANQINRWAYALLFKGYMDYKFVQYKDNEMTGILLNLNLAGTGINLRMAGKNELIDCQCSKFEFGEDIYIIEGFPY